MRAPAPTTQTYTVPGNAITVTLTATDTGLPRVETRQSGFICDDWTRTYASATEARNAARRVAQIFKTHKSVVAVERRRAELVAICDRSRNPHTVHAADAEYDTLRDLHDRLGELITDVTTYLEAA